MELTLNLVWVFVAIAGILVQIVTLWRTAGSSQAQASPVRKAVAMGCALVILFFVISMTDDLHDQVLVWEESKQSRTSAVAKAAASPTLDHSLSPSSQVFTLPVVLPPPAPAWGRLVARGHFQVLPAAVEESFGGRAPPTSLI